MKRSITVLEAIKQLSSVCDGALTDDGQGFAACDVGLKVYAVYSCMTYSQQLEAQSRLIKYKDTQLGVNEITIENYGENNDVIARQEVEFVKTIFKSVKFINRIAYISFQYCSFMVRDVKKISGARYMPETQQWSVFINNSNQDSLYPYLDKYGFSYEKPELDPKGGLIPDNRIEFSKGRVNVYFNYDPRLVELVKKISGRRFEGSGKYWHFELNKHNYPEVQNLLNNCKFHITPEFDELIVKFRREYEREIELVESNVEASMAFDADLEIEGLTGKLMSFQKAGVKYVINNKKVILGDEMGLGKTIQAISAIQHENAYPCLVVCPNSLKYNWKKEFDKWISYKDAEDSIWCQVLNSDSDARVVLDSASVVVVNYNTVVKFQKILCEVDWKAVVCDESHYLKNKKAQRTQAVRTIIQETNPELSLLLTGTAIVNRPVEITSQLDIIDRLQDFGGWWKFVHRYCGAYRDQWGLNTGGATNLEELHNRMRSLCYVRRDKNQVLDELPEKQITSIEFEIDNVKEYVKAEKDIVDYIKNNARETEKFQQSLIGLTQEEAKAARKAYREEKSHAAEMAEHLVRINYLKQISVKGKIKGMIEWVEDVVDSGEKIVVFAVHKAVVKAVAEHFKCRRIDGSVKAEDRQAYVDEFQNNPSVKVIVLNITAGSVGLTLTAASKLCFFELGWTPGEHAQAEARIHRISQKNAVDIYYLIGRETIDEDIYDLLEKKRVVTDAVNAGVFEDQEKGSVMNDLIDRIKQY